jgi:hypothetical protein
LCPMPNFLELEHAELPKLKPYTDVGHSTKLRHTLWRCPCYICNLKNIFSSIRIPIVHWDKSCKVLAE